RHSKWWQAPLRWAMRGALAARASLVVRKSRREQAKGQL
ncbi:MAG TPA: dTDP-Rha--alpha-D-GlcNAc-pyrophosphate polyprenol alpha-3-L-rhamnosyltransferase, partial [Mycobacterium sp.]|nr:dTDP-Rha--alpha-D-GlcNAc-pyrophosphate polyprenol alpha-3-L-rhamnosyltransferase [Mycobacterium sp.]